MKQFVVDHLQAECHRATRITVCASTGGADLLVELAAGRRVALYVVNRAIRVPEITALIERNTQHHVYTLFVLDARMLPGEHERVDPPPWMSMLHALAHGRLYAYWCDQRRVTIRPVHLDWRWGGSTRAVTFGEPVDFSKLRVEMATYTSRHLTGRFAAADFGEGAFWKKATLLDELQHDTSWRRWGYVPPARKRAQREAEEPSYDPWEAYERHYGEVGSGPDFAGWRRQQRDSRKTPRRVQTVLMRQYALLGLTREATFDEVKQAYRRKARENHPDLHPNEKDHYTLRMAEINAAFEAIRKLLLQE